MLADTQEVVVVTEESKHVLEVQDSSGDTKIMWDPEVEDEVEAAKETFHKMLGKGYQAYSVKRNGQKDKLITEFDRDEAKIIMTPRMVGG